MPISVDVRITTRDWMRKYLGDLDRLLFTDDELDAILQGHVWPGMFYEQLVCQALHFRSIYAGPVVNLVIMPNDGDDSHYRVDENTKHVQWMSGSAEPANYSYLKVEYQPVEFIPAVCEALTIVATDRTRLSVKASFERMVNDLTGLRKEIMSQVQTLMVMNSWNE